MRATVFSQKPWGYELLFETTDRLAVKMLKITAGNKTSLQYHNEKEEVLVVTEGIVNFFLYNEVGQLDEDSPITCKVGEYILIPAKKRHRTQALEDATLIEVSTPELDDVVRVLDDYGRV